MSRAEAHSTRHTVHPAKTRWSRWKRLLTMLFFLALIVLADDVRRPASRMERSVRHPRRLQGTYAGHRLGPDAVELFGLRLFRPDRPQLHSPGPDVETDPASGDHQLRLQSQFERVGGWHRHALSAVFTIGCEQGQYRKNPRPEPGNQLVWLHADRRGGVQHRTGANAAGLETQQRCITRCGRTVAAGERGLSGGLSIFPSVGNGPFAGWKSTCRRCVWRFCSWAWGRSTGR